MASGRFALGFRVQSSICDDVVHELALVGAHRIQMDLLASFANRGNGVLSNLAQQICTLCTVAGNVQDRSQSALRAG